MRRRSSVEKALVGAKVTSPSGLPGFIMAVNEEEKTVSIKLGAGAIRVGYSFSKPKVPSGK